MHLVMEKASFALHIFAQLGKLSYELFDKLGSGIHAQLYA
jgi:hypothetical protein